MNIQISILLFNRTKTLIKSITTLDITIERISKLNFGPFTNFKFVRFEADFEFYLVSIYFTTVYFCFFYLNDIINIRWVCYLV